jgi:hypothetical protein
MEAHAVVWRRCSNIWTVGLDMAVNLPALRSGRERIFILLISVVGFVYPIAVAGRIRQIEKKIR